MKKLYLVNTKHKKNFDYESKEVLFFENSHKDPISFEENTITSAFLAKQALNHSQNKKVYSNNINKASIIYEKNLSPLNFDIFLLFNDPIETDLTNKTIYIIEDNKDINKFDATKIFFTTPWPPLFEYVLNKYKEHEIIIVSNDENDILGASYYNLKSISGLY